MSCKSSISSTETAQPTTTSAFVASSSLVPGPESCSSTGGERRCRWIRHSSPCSSSTDSTYLQAIGVADEVVGSTRRLRHFPRSGRAGAHSSRT
eukprot:scaffold44727_cov35-Tisochrysis_lutea.AAC.1